MVSLSLDNFQQSFDKVIAIAKNQPVEIEAGDGTTYILQIKQTTNQNLAMPKRSLLDVEGIDVPNLTQDDVIQMVRQSRERPTVLDL